MPDRRAPAARVHWCLSPQVRGITRRFLCSGFNDLSRVLADDEFVLATSPAKLRFACVPRIMDARTIRSRRPQLR